METSSSEPIGVIDLLLNGLTWKRAVALAAVGGAALTALLAMVTREHSRVALNHLGMTPESVGLNGVLSDLGEGLATWIIALAIVPLCLGVAALFVALHVLRLLGPGLWAARWSQGHEKQTSSESFDRKDAVRITVASFAAFAVLFGSSVAMGRYTRGSPLSTMIEPWFVVAVWTTLVMAGLVVTTTGRRCPVLIAISVLAIPFALASLSTLGDARGDAQQFQDGGSLAAMTSLELDLGRWCQSHEGAQIEWSVLRFDGDDIYVLETQGVTRLPRAGSWLRTSCDG